MTTTIGSLLDPRDPTSRAASSSERHRETPYVRACTNCVRAKAKCSPNISADAEGKCERYGVGGSHPIDSPP